MVFPASPFVLTKAKAAFTKSILAKGLGIDVISLLAVAPAGSFIDSGSSPYTLLLYLEEIPQPLILSLP